MPPYVAPLPRAFVGVIVIVLALVFYLTGNMDPKIAVVFGVCGLGLMSA